MYKKCFFPLFFLFLFFEVSVNAQDTDPNLGIIPAPVSVKKSSGTFVLSVETRLFADTVSNKAVSFFADYLQNNAMLRIQPKAN